MYQLRSLGEFHHLFNDPIKKNYDGLLSARSTRIFTYVTSQSEIYPSNLLHCSLFYMMVVKVIVIKAFTIENQLANMTKEAAGLSKNFEG